VGKRKRGNRKSRRSKYSKRLGQQMHELQMVAWLKAYHRDIKHIDDLPRNVIIDYLQKRQHEGLSPNTLSRDLGAVNKLFNVNITKKKLIWLNAVIKKSPVRVAKKRITNTTTRKIMNNKSLLRKRSVFTGKVL